MFLGIFTNFNYEFCGRYYYKIDCGSKTFVLYCPMQEAMFIASVDRERESNKLGCAGCCRPSSFLPEP